MNDNETVTLVLDVVDLPCPTAAVLSEYFWELADFGDNE